MSATQNDDRLSLHDVYREQMQCGYTRDLVLPSHGVATLAGRLRGIQAVGSVLLAGEGLDMNLGEWLRSGLIEAVLHLAGDAHSDLDALNDHAAKEESRAAQHQRNQQQNTAPGHAQQAQAATVSVAKAPTKQGDRI